MNAKSFVGKFFRTKDLQASEYKKFSEGIEKVMLASNPNQSLTLKHAENVLDWLEKNPEIFEDTTLGFAPLEGKVFPLSEVIEACKIVTAMKPLNARFQAIQNPEEKSQPVAESAKLDAKAEKAKLEKLAQVNAG